MLSNPGDEMYENDAMRGKRSRRETAGRNDQFPKV